MSKINKITNITLIFMIISAVFSQIAGASDNVYLRVPIGINKERMNIAGDFFVPDVAKSLELRGAIKHDMGRLLGTIKGLFYEVAETSHSDDFDKAKNDLLEYITKLHNALDRGNINWESDFKAAFNEFMSNISDDTMELLCKEVDGWRSNGLRNSVEGMRLFYKSFVGTDPAADIDLKKIFNIVKTNEASLPEDFIVLSLNIRETARHIRGKEGEIYRAFLNLVRNAVEEISNQMTEVGYPKAFAMRGLINVNTYYDNGYSVIEISDNGRGMPKEALEVWKNRTVYSSKGEQGGRGIKAARNIIERNNGTMDVRSESGKGTTFIIKFPQITAEEAFSEFQEETLDAAKMIDSLGIGHGDNVLLVGPGAIAVHAVACEIKGAKVDIVQPSHDYEQPQTKQLQTYIDAYRYLIAGKFGKDSVKNNIDTDSYQGYVQDVNIPKKHYSHAFILNVLEEISDERAKIEAVKAILVSLKDEAVILMSSYSVSGRTEEQFETLKDIARKSGYNIDFVKSFNKEGFFYPDDVREFKVTRINQETLSQKLINKEVLTSN